MSKITERHLWVWYTPCGMGGVETYLLNMARETIADGHEVFIGATTDVLGPLRESLLAAGVQLLDWTEFHPAFMARQPAQGFQQRLLADIARIRPTLLALNDCNDFSIGVAPLLKRLRPYCTVIDTFHIDSPVEQYLEFRRYFLDALDGVAATNQNVIDRFHRRYPHASKIPARYIANGVSVPDRERRPADGTLRMLYVGRLAQDQKRIMALPPLLEQLRARGRSFSMTIVGDGPCRDALASQISQRGLDADVRLTGYLSPQQVLDLYFEHDVLVNLSTFEGFSMSVLEAFAAGCVPVCTDIDSLDRSVFVDGRNCRLCPVDQLDEMVRIWSELSPASLDQLSSNALATGRQFSASRMYHGYRQFLADLRTARPLETWPLDPGPAIRLEWDLCEHNPWLVRPHPLRNLASSAWARVMQVLGGRGS